MEASRGLSGAGDLILPSVTNAEPSNVLSFRVLSGSPSRVSRSCGMSTCGMKDLLPCCEPLDCCAAVGAVDREDAACAVVVLLVPLSVFTATEGSLTTTVSRSELSASKVSTCATV